MTPTEPTIRAPEPEEAATIAALARRTFTETFGYLYAPEDLAAFLAQHSEAEWRAQILDPAYHIRLVEMPGQAGDGRADDGPAGFLKLGPPSLPFTPQCNAIELRQFYLLSPWHGPVLPDGGRLSDIMMERAVSLSRALGFSELYLSVFIDNHRARRFYARHGFEDVGPYAFKVGNHEDEDIVMRKAL